MFDFTHLRLSSIDKPSYAQNFWQKIFDAINVADESARMSDHVNFIFGTNSSPFPDGADPLGILKDIDLKIEGEYYFREGELRIDYTVGDDGYEELLAFCLEANGFKWDENKFRHIINIYSKI